jgi:hypothetical protein
MLQTDDVIARLGREVTAVRPLSPPAQRTALWAAGAAIYLLVMAVVDLMAAPRLPVVTASYLVQEGASLIVGLTAAYLAFASVVPGVRSRGRWLLAAAASAWVLWLLREAARDLQTSGTLGLSGRSDLSCVLAMILSGALLCAPLVVMLRQGAALAPRTSLLLAGLAAMSLANLEACLIRPHGFESVVLLWHGGAIAATTAVCAWMGRRWLPWPPRPVAGVP